MVKNMYFAKTSDSVKMPVAVLSWVGPSNHASLLDGDPALPKGKGQIFLFGGGNVVAQCNV